MEWTILLMLSRPETQTKLQQEIDNVLGTRPPSLADRQSMPYCEALIEEVMRMSPLTFFAVPHMTSRDTKIGQHFCPKGTTVSFILLMQNRNINVSTLQVMWFTGGFHLSEEHFDKPMEFNPDRFLDDAGRFKPSDIISFFGVGKRRCPGETLARTQVNYCKLNQERKVISHLYLCFYIFLHLDLPLCCNPVPTIQFQTSKGLQF